MRLDRVTIIGVMGAFLVAGCDSPATITCDGPCACISDSDCAAPACVVDSDCPKSPTGTADGCCAGRCLVVDSDAQNCGGCARVCTPPVNGVPACKAGVCGLGACAKGYADCNGNAADGCEIKTDTDGKNCGACGTVCLSGPNQSTSCVLGTCTRVCPPGYAHCSMMVADGCEVHTDLDLKNCGGCGVGCGPLANASAVCTTGKCGVMACTGKFADCNRNALDGCESPLDADPNNCGMCGTVCAPIANSTPVCAGSVCAVGKCNLGFANCNGLYLDGCEVNTQTDANNCGTCSYECRGNQSVQVCQASKCGIDSCSAGYADCDHIAATGCEVDTGTDVANCGACGMACALPANAMSVVCGNGTCGVGVCSFGFADCNMLVADGCEISLLTDVKNCSACGAACVVPNAVPACAMGKCGMNRCNGGFADCDKLVGNGCEVNIQTDPKNCGLCGVVCASNLCQGGICRHPIQFAAAQETDPGIARMAALVTGDFNGDGKADLVVALDSGSLDVFIGKGDGTFQAPKSLSGAGPGGSPRLAVGDLNNDGNQDLVSLIFAKDGEHMCINLGVGDGTFKVGPSTLLKLDIDPLVLADTDGDGNLDAAVCSGAGLAVMIGNGDGTLQAPGKAVLPLCGPAVAADFNGDSLPDLATLVDAPVVLDILLSQKGAGFLPAIARSVDKFAHQVVVGDLNKAGLHDLVVISNAVSFDEFKGKGDGTFWPVLNTPVVASTLFGAAADFDSDGLADVAVLRSLAFDVFRSSGGGFEAAKTFIVASGNLLATGDFDGDAKPDVVIALDSIIVFLNTTK